MDAVRTHLVRRGARVVLVLTPPFDQSAQDPGYVKGYPPGVRENGGQYTHAAVWTVMAVAPPGKGGAAGGAFPPPKPLKPNPGAPGGPPLKARPDRTPRGRYPPPA